MSQKRKADIVTDKMRERLMSNRDGRIATDQWLDLVIDPLVTLLLLVVPAAIILGPRFTAFVVSLQLPIILLLALVAVGVPLFLRARRYARAPLHFDILTAEENPRGPLLFWRPQQFETQDGEIVRFYKRLSPFMYFRPGYPYMVYFLEEPGGNILLSVAPTDHPDAEKWYPTKFFERRQARRVHRQSSSGV